MSNFAHINDGIAFSSALPRQKFEHFHESETNDLLCGLVEDILERLYVCDQAGFHHGEQ